MSKYNNGTDATGGANIRVDMYDRAAIQTSVDDLVYGRYVDKKTQDRSSGKVFKISRFHHILTKWGHNDAGIDSEGKVIGATDFIFNGVAYSAEADAVAAKTTYDATAEGIADKANNVEKKVVSVVSTGGSSNLYGASRNVGTVSSSMPSLSEGASDVNEVGVVRENFEAKLFRRGAFEPYTDEVVLFSDHDMQMEYRTKLARLGVEMKEDDTQLGMLASAGVRVYPGAATSIDTVNSQMDEELLNKLVKQLQVNKAERNSTIIGGSTGVGTEPINKGYYGITGPDVCYGVVKKLPNFMAVHKYPNRDNIDPNEFGAVDEVRFILSNRALYHEGEGADSTDNPDNLLDTDSKFNVYPVIFPTKSSYATIGLAGKGKITFKSKAPGEATETDKYGVKGFFSMNYFHGGLALQPEKLAVLYTATV